MNVVITGASSGIGEALAVEAAKRGAERLFLCARNAERLEAVAEKCRGFGAKVSARTVYVTDGRAVAEWLGECAEVAPLDIVFANAGVSTGAETEENVRRTFATNVDGVVNTALPAIEIFRRQGGGQLVITASIAGYAPLTGCPAYSGTKACVKNWGLALRGHLRREHIKVNVVCPGFVRSRITDANRCPMPFFMEADRAARIILNRVRRNVGLIAFPWPMRFASWLLSVLPWRVAELVSRALPKKIL